MRVRMGVCVFLTALMALAVLGQGECTREYKGDLVLTGDQRLVITEGTLCVHGRIIVQDGAKLLISNATLRRLGLEESLWDPSAPIVLQGDAELVMTNVRIEAPGVQQGSVPIWAHDRARVELHGVETAQGIDLGIGVWEYSRVFIETTRLGTVGVQDEASLDVRDSSIQWLDLSFGGAPDIEVADLRRGKYAEWHMARRPGVGWSVQLQNTEVAGGWCVQVRDRARVTIRNSHDIGVVLRFSQFPALISGLRPGYYSRWSLVGEGSSPGTGNLTLLNTSVGWSDIHLIGRRDAITIQHTGPTNFHVWDSTALVRLEGVAIASLLAHNSHLTIDSRASSIQDGFELKGTRLDISGTFSVNRVNPTVIWSAATSFREYEVRVRDRAGQPTAGVHVRLEDPSGWITTHTTDQDGVLRFTIRFDDTNYDKTWHLIAPRGDTIVRTPIQFTTSTPLIVSTW